MSDWYDPPSVDSDWHEWALAGRRRWAALSQLVQTHVVTAYRCRTDHLISLQHLYCDGRVVTAVLWAQMSAAAWLYDRRGQTEQGTHGSVRGSAWRWTQTNASSDLESLRIGSTDPELVCRHPHLGAAPPPGPRQGPRAGHGDPLELLLSFGLSPAPVVSNCRFAAAAFLPGACN